MLLAMKKLVSYLVFIAVGIAKSARTGHPLSFIAVSKRHPEQVMLYSRKPAGGETKTTLSAQTVVHAISALAEECLDRGVDVVLGRIDPRVGAYASTTNFQTYKCV
jgi:hypothetical protein